MNRNPADNLNGRVISPQMICRDGRVHKRSGYRHVRHGGTGSELYVVWAGMRDRCANPRTGKWANYGGRGIYVCRRWLKFENFAADMGPRPSPEHSIDRIDPNGNYEPSNCRWATQKIQVQNRRKAYEVANSYFLFEPMHEDAATVRDWSRAFCWSLADDDEGFE